jgi:hypothetical protein
MGPEKSRCPHCSKQIPVSLVSHSQFRSPCFPKGQTTGSCIGRFTPHSSIFPLPSSLFHGRQPLVPITTQTHRPPHQWIGGIRHVILLRGTRGVLPTQCLLLIPMFITRDSVSFLPRDNPFYSPPTAFSGRKPHVHILHSFACNAHEFSTPDHDLLTTKLATERTEKQINVSV